MESSNVTNLGMLSDTPVTLSVELAVSQIPTEDVLRFEVGTIVRLDQPATAPVILSINGKNFAHGEIVLAGDHRAVRITDLNR